MYQLTRTYMLICYSHIHNIEPYKELGGARPLASRQETQHVEDVYGRLIHGSSDVVCATHVEREAQLLERRGRLPHGTDNGGEINPESFGHSEPFRVLDKPKEGPDQEKNGDGFTGKRTASCRISTRDSRTASCSRPSCIV
jgi:hypothetical protein